VERPGCAPTGSYRIVQAAAVGRLNVRRWRPCHDSDRDGDSDEKAAPGKSDAAAARRTAVDGPGVQCTRARSALSRKRGNLQPFILASLQRVWSWRRREPFGEFSLDPARSSGALPASCVSSRLLFLSLIHAATLLTATACELDDGRAKRHSRTTSTSAVTNPTVAIIYSRFHRPRP
jgi:hypothetical protein